MVQLTDCLQFFLQLVIVSQPTLDLLPLLGSNTDLFVAPAGIVDGEDQGRMAAAASTGLAAFLVPDGALEQGTANNLGRRADGPRQRVALLEGVSGFQLYR